MINRIILPAVGIGLLLTAEAIGNGQLAAKTQGQAERREESAVSPDRDARIRVLLDMIAEIREREGGLTCSDRVASAMDAFIEEGQLESAKELYLSLAWVVAGENLSDTGYWAWDVARSYVRVVCRVEGTAAAAKYVRRIAEHQDTYVHPTSLAPLWAELVHEAVRNGDLFDATTALANAEPNPRLYLKASGTLAKAYAERGDAEKGELIIDNMLALLKTKTRNPSLEMKQSVSAAIQVCIQAGFPKKGRDLWEFCASEWKRREKNERRSNERHDSIWGAPDPTEQEVAKKTVLEIVTSASVDLVGEWLQLIEDDCLSVHFTEQLLRELAERGDDEFAFPLIVRLARRWTKIDGANLPVPTRDVEPLFRSIYHLLKAIHSHDTVSMAEHVECASSCIQGMQYSADAALSLAKVAEQAAPFVHDEVSALRCERAKAVRREFLGVGWRQQAGNQKPDRDLFSLALALDDIVIAEENCRMWTGSKRMDGLAKLAAKAGELGQLGEAKRFLAELAKVPYQSRLDRLLETTRPLEVQTNPRLEAFDTNNDGTVDLEEARVARAKRWPERTGLDRVLDWNRTGRHVLKARAFLDSEEITREQLARWVEACANIPFPIHTDDLLAVLVKTDRLELAVFTAELERDMIQKQIDEGEDRGFDYAGPWNGFIRVRDLLYDKNPTAALIVGCQIGDQRQRNTTVFQFVRHELTTGDLESGLRYARVINKEIRDIAITDALAWLVQHE